MLRIVETLHGRDNVRRSPSAVITIESLLDIKSSSIITGNLDLSEVSLFKFGW